MPGQCDAMALDTGVLPALDCMAERCRWQVRRCLPAPRPLGPGERIAAAARSASASSCLGRRTIHPQLHCVSQPTVREAVARCEDKTLAGRFMLHFHYDHDHDNRLFGYQDGLSSSAARACRALGVVITGRKHIHTCQLCVTKQTLPQLPGGATTTGGESPPRGT